MILFGIHNKLIQGVLTAAVLIMITTAHPPVVISQNHPEPLPQELTSTDNMTLAQADSLGQVANEFRKSKQFDEGLTALTLQLEIRKRLLGIDHHEIGNTHYELGRILQAAGQTDKARSAFEESLTVLIAALGDEHIDTAAPRNRLARMALHADDLSVAEAQWRATLSIVRTHYEPTHMAVISTLDNLATVVDRLGHPRDALTYRLDSLELTRQRFGNQHSRVAGALGRLGSTYRSLGEHDNAASSYAEALDTFRIVGDDSSPSYAACLNGLALTQRQRKNLIAAEPLQRRALAVARSNYGDRHPSVARLLNNLAYLLKLQGKYVDASDLHLEALDIQRDMADEDGLEVADTLTHLATLERARHDLTAAEARYKEALSIQVQHLGEDHIGTARLLNNIALLSVERGAYDEAYSLFLRSLDIRQRILPSGHPGIATGMANLAQLHVLAGRPNEADRLFQETLSIRRRSLGRTHPDVGSTLTEIARMELARGHTDEAVRYLKEAAVIHDSARLRTSMGMSRATSEIKDPYPMLAIAELDLGHPEMAWSATEHSRARALGDLLFGASARSLTDSEIAHEDSLRSKLMDLEQRRVASLQVSSSDQSLFDELNREHDACELAWAELHHNLADKYPLQEGQPLSLEHIRTTLSPETALIGWSEGNFRGLDQQAWVWLLRNEGPVRWFQLPAGAASDTSSTAPHSTLRRHLSSPLSSRKELNATARELWALHMGPLDDSLDGVTNLVIIPSGVMLGLPVEVLIDGQGQLIDDRFVVSYAPSASVYAWLSERADSRAHDRLDNILLLGDPPFQAKHLSAMTVQDKDPLSPASHLHRSNTTAAFDDSSLAALPRLTGTRREVESIAELWPTAHILTGPDASEQRIAHLTNSGELGNFDVIHLATHAIIDDDRPGRSALVLSQVNLPSALERAVADERVFDGLITANEIAAEWSLSAEVVILSACSTGLGRKTAGEGYIGFAQAFLQAGANGLAVSLWPVGDRATAQLMEQFHVNLLQESGTPSAAMSKARHHLRNSRGRGRRLEFAHPFHWASFIVIGNSNR